MDFFDFLGTSWGHFFDFSGSFFLLFLVFFYIFFTFSGLVWTFCEKFKKNFFNLIF